MTVIGHVSNISTLHLCIEGTPVTVECYRFIGEGILVTLLCVILSRHAIYLKQIEIMKRASDLTEMCEDFSSASCILCGRDKITIPGRLTCASDKQGGIRI